MFHVKTNFNVTYNFNLLLTIRMLLVFLSKFNKTTQSCIESILHYLELIGESMYNENNIKIQDYNY